LLLGVSVTAIGCEEDCYDGYCRRGYYYDSLVSGVAYASRNAEVPTKTGVTGVTGEDGDPGAFGYANGDSVSFSLGATNLGETVASARVTPFDLAGVTEEPVGGCEVDEDLLPEDDFRIVQNLAVLLQTLDTDGDPTAGIEISAEVAALFNEVTVDMDQSWEAFQADTGLQSVLTAADLTLRTRKEALEALYQGIGLCTDGGTGGTGGTAGSGGEGGAGGTAGVGGIGGTGGTACIEDDQPGCDPAELNFDCCEYPDSYCDTVDNTCKSLL
jgi:hypothetical protein